MTIAQPNRDRQATCIMRMIIAGIILTGLVSVYAYNETVLLRRHVIQTVNATEQLKVRNAGLKNELYALLDSKQLISVASRLGLVKESKPTYLSLSITGASSKNTQAAFEYR